VLGFALTLTLMLATVTHADSSVYVASSPNCSDSVSSKQAASAGSPWCTIAHALSVAPDGSTILVRQGTYPEIDVAGVSHAAYVTVEPYPGESVRVAGAVVRTSDHLRFQGLTSTAPFRVIETAHDIQFIGNDIGNTVTGIYLYGWVNPVRPPVRDVVIRGNTIHDIDYAGSQGVSDGYGTTACQPILGTFCPQFGLTSVTMHLAKNGSRSG